jgi:hypothetical protein
MTSFETRLSASGLQNLPAYHFSNDFCFVLSDTSYHCSSFIADFLSPTIARLHFSDCSLDKYIIQTGDPNHQFPSFLSLGAGSPLLLNESNRSFFLSISKELGNSELYFSILDHFET